MLERPYGLDVAREAEPAPETGGNERAGERTGEEARERLAWREREAEEGQLAREGWRQAAPGAADGGRGGVGPGEAGLRVSQGR